jgi:signal transduction histidine kinase
MTTSWHGSPGDETHRIEPGLAPEALFEAATGHGGDCALQWLAHLQRLASTGLLAGGMAHDLAGLVQPLLGEAERGLLQEDPAEHRLALVRMREWARRCESYVRALLDLVRRDEQHRTVVDVEAVVEDTLQLLESTQRTIGVSMCRNLDNHHTALVDRTRLMQALVNLVTNALRAARAGGREVGVTVRGWRGWVVIEVKDNGPGIPPEIRERLFQPFVRRASPASTPGRDGPAEPEGTGLGLYITKRLIQEQGGRVEFETDEGVGTMFRLMLEPAPVDGAAPEEGAMRQEHREKR